MTARPFLVFLMAVILTAIFVPPVQSTQIPCITPDRATVFEPVENVKGWGVRDGGLVKLSVSSEGYFLITLSPPEMSGMVCIVVMGTDWHFVTPEPVKGEEADG